MKIDAYIPASIGESTKHKHYPKLLDRAGVKNKALIPLGGKPMIEHVVEALDNADHIASITIVGNDWDDYNFTISKPLTVIPGGDTSFQSLQMAVKYFKTKELASPYIMNVSSDIPLITGEMVDTIIEQTDFSRELELYLNITTAQITKKIYPEAHKVPIKLRETQLYVGDIHIFHPDVVDTREEALMHLMENRKSVWGVIKVISLRYIFKYMIRRLTIDDIRKRFKKLFDLDAAFILTSFPEPCLDLDYSSDLDLFAKWIDEKDRRSSVNNKVWTIQSTEEMMQFLQA